MSGAARGRFGSERATIRRRELRRALTRHRRLLAATLAAGATAVAVSAATPPPPELRDVVVAAHDLGGGLPLTGADLRVTALPGGAVPQGAVLGEGELTGRILAGPVRAGEVITDVRLVGTSLLTGQPAGTVAALVRIADPASVGLLRAGDLIDVVAADTTITIDGSSGSAARVVAGGVRVLAVPAPADGGYAAGLEGALIVLATSPAEALELATAAVTGRLSVTLRPA